MISIWARGIGVYSDIGRVAKYLQNPQKGNNNATFRHAPPSGLGACRIDQTLSIVTGWNPSLEISLPASSCVFLARRSLAVTGPDSALRSEAGSASPYQYLPRVPSCYNNHAGTYLDHVILHLSQTELSESEFMLDETGPTTILLPFAIIRESEEHRGYIQLGHEMLKETRRKSMVAKSWFVSRSSTSTLALTSAYLVDKYLESLSHWQHFKVLEKNAEEISFYSHTQAVFDHTGYHGFADWAEKVSKTYELILARFGVSHLWTTLLNVSVSGSAGAVGAAICLLNVSLFVLHFPAGPDGQITDAKLEFDIAPPPAGSLALVCLAVAVVVTLVAGLFHYIANGWKLLIGDFVGKSKTSGARLGGLSMR
ncbi:hypothetical protein BU15DRAFT_65633 [Melanogaster broomeanus]|nr:hypothetical protein BU15DRAFT_65633 [Melanogaster broomeanus]